MFSINQKDTNVSVIYTEAKLQTLNTNYEYRVYGLKQEDNPVILISNPHISGISDNLRRLKRFFTKNNIQFEVETVDVRRLSIGFRRDLREHVILAAALLQTIVYGLEDKLNIDLRFSIPKLPKFDAGPETAAKRRKPPESADEVRNMLRRRRQSSVTV